MWEISFNSFRQSPLLLCQFSEEWEIHCQAGLTNDLSPLHKKRYERRGGSAVPLRSVRRKGRERTLKGSQLLELVVFLQRMLRAGWGVLFKGHSPWVGFPGLKSHTLQVRSLGMTFRRNFLREPTVQESAQLQWARFGWARILGRPAGSEPMLSSSAPGKEKG